MPWVFYVHVQSRSRDLVDKYDDVEVIDGTSFLSLVMSITGKGDIESDSIKCRRQRNENKKVSQLILHSLPQRFAFFVAPMMPSTAA